jgi:hypothetical protein
VNEINMKRFLALLLTCSLASICQGQNANLRQSGETLISRMPKAEVSTMELNSACHSGGLATDDKETYNLLLSRRVHLLAIQAWGMKWFPSHSTILSQGCTDHVFLINQYQRAHGNKERGQWSRSDVEQLIAEAVPMANYLVSTGEFDRVIMEPIPQ